MFAWLSAVSGTVGKPTALLRTKRYRRIKRGTPFLRAAWAARASSLRTAAPKTFATFLLKAILFTAIYRAWYRALSNSAAQTRVLVVKTITASTRSKTATHLFIQIWCSGIAELASVPIRQAPNNSMPCHTSTDHRLHDEPLPPPQFIRRCNPHARTSANKRLLVGCSSLFMRLAQYLTALASR